MRIVNSKNLEPVKWSSPKGTMAGEGLQISEGLGRNRDSTDLMERHPFDVELMTIPAGMAPYPYHAHSAQWEFYHIVSGSGTLRHQDGIDNVRAGDACIFKPGEPHQFVAGNEPLVMYVVADNPIGEFAYYPDSKKWAVRMPERRIMRGENLDYFDGEE